MKTVISGGEYGYPDPHYLTNLFQVGVIYSFIHPFILSFIYSSFHLCIYAFVHKFICAFFHLFIYSSFYPAFLTFINSSFHLLFIHSFTHIFSFSSHIRREPANGNKQFKETKTWFVFNSYLIQQSFKVTIVNRTLQSLHEESLQITIYSPFNELINHLLNEGVGRIWYKRSRHLVSYIQTSRTQESRGTINWRWRSSDHINRIIY